MAQVFLFCWEEELDRQVKRLTEEGWDLSRVKDSELADFLHAHRRMTQHWEPDWSQQRLVLRDCLKAYLRGRSVPEPSTPSIPPEALNC